MKLKALFPVALLSGFSVSAFAASIPGAALIASNIPVLTAAHKSCAENYAKASTWSDSTGKYTGAVSGSWLPAPSSSVPIGSPTFLIPQTLARLCDLSAAQLGNSLYVTRLYQTYWDAYRENGDGYCASAYTLARTGGTRGASCSW